MKKPINTLPEKPKYKVKDLKAGGIITVGFDNHPTVTGLLLPHGSETWGYTVVALNKRRKFEYFVFATVKQVISIHSGPDLLSGMLAAAEMDVHLEQASDPVS